MRLFNFRFIVFVFVAASFCGCTNMNKTGESTTSEGTVVDDRNNSDMENQRTSADADTVASPGSNSANIKSGEYNARDEQKQIPNDNSENQKGADKTK